MDGENANLGQETEATQANFNAIPNVEEVEDSFRGSVDLQPGESRFWGYACIVSGMLTQTVI